MILNNLLKTESEVLKCIEESLSSNKLLCITYFNQYCFNIYSANNNYRKILDTKFIAYSDGIGIYFALKLLNIKVYNRFDGTDLIERIFNLYSSANAKLFLIGGDFETKLLTRMSMEKKFLLSGYHNGYFEEDELHLLIDEIRNSKAEVLIVGMGVPMQEIISQKISECTELKIIHCVGGFLEFYFGTKKRAPEWMRRIGLEWLHRLLTEPRRLWQRYISGIPRFVIQVIKLKIFYKK